MFRRLQRYRLFLLLRFAAGVSFVSLGTSRAYAGGIGAVSFGGDMDIALALRTMVIPTTQADTNRWTVHLQAGAGIVADSVPQREFEETVNKAAALGRAIDLAESAFGR